jgi:hypothetical protein
MRRSLVHLAAHIACGLLLTTGVATGRSAAAPCDAGKTWSVTPAGTVLEIGYGCGTDFPQHAAVHRDSCYVRVVPSADSSLATSVIACPSYWGVESGLLSWQPVSAPAADLRQIVGIPGVVFVRTTHEVFRTFDGGATWDELARGSGPVFDLEFDSGVLYVAEHGCYEASDELGDTWRDLVGQCPCSWDNCAGIDLHDGVGWVAADGWGFQSGPSRRSEGGLWRLSRGDLPFVDVNLKSVVVAPADPARVAYVASSSGRSYVTRDGGEHWHAIPEQVLFATSDTVYTSTLQSNDDGSTWEPHGIGCARAFTAGELEDGLFVATCDGGIRRRSADGRWQRAGLEGEVAVSLATSDGYLYAVLASGEMLRAPLQASGGEVYYQGTPIDTSWKVRGRRLIVRLEGFIGDLGFAGKMVFLPPARGAMKARVSVRTFGTPPLADRPGEAFKPVMLSSMRISPSVWDASHVVVGPTVFSIPDAGLVFPGGALSSADFGVLGGSSAWKTRAPTVTVHAPAPMSVQGYVTASADPNDDNVGLWLASQTVLPSWRYRLRVLRAE